MAARAQPRAGTTAAAAGAGAQQVAQAQAQAAQARRDRAANEPTWEDYVNVSAGLGAQVAAQAGLSGRQTSGPCHPPRARGMTMLMLESSATTSASTTRTTIRMMSGNIGAPAE